jgi:hypothetical protein
MTNAPYVYLAKAIRISRFQFLLGFNLFGWNIPLCTKSWRMGICSQYKNYPIVNTFSWWHKWNETIPIFHKLQISHYSICYHGNHFFTHMKMFNRVEMRSQKLSRVMVIKSRYLLMMDERVKPYTRDWNGCLYHKCPFTLMKEASYKRTKKPINHGKTQLIFINTKICTLPFHLYIVTSK